MELGKLVCGVAAEACIANSTLDHLGSSIDRFGSRAVGYLNGEFSEEARVYGAFCARVTLENACAALVGRFDPFRLLYLAEFQAQEKFEYGKPTKSGFRWLGDVVAEEKPPPVLWSSDLDTSRISRALLSAHADHVYWKPAVELALDYLSEHEDVSLQELRSMNPETFTSAVRGKGAALYSTLSKGVHWDFFVESVVMDEATLKDGIRDLRNPLILQITCINRPISTPGSENRTQL